MSKIIRRPDMASGGVTAEEKARMAEHAKLWAARAFRTDPIEPDKIIPAIEGIYAAAGLAKPIVVIAPSPLVMAFAYGAAAAIWYRKSATIAATIAATDAATDAATYAATYAATDAATRAATIAATIAATDAATYAATYAATDAATRAATYAATDDATIAATYAATIAATYAATHAATRAATDAATIAATIAATDAATIAATIAATDAATYAATYAATDAATRAATYAATHAATRAATYAATRAATSAATNDATRDATYAATGDAPYAAMACYDLAGDFGIQCAARWTVAYQGGNMWAAWDCYLTAGRDILGLNLPAHEKYAFWEQAAIHGGFRVMHEKFCIVSDFPEFINVDDQNRPHCETGPSHRWRDGWSLYHWHGVAIPSHWIENRATLDPVEVLREENVDRRMAGCQIIGWPRMAEMLDRKIIDGDPDTDIGALVELTMPGLPEPGRFLMARCPRNGTICEGVPPVSDIDGLPINTAIAAQAWRDCLPVSEYTHPAIRT